MILQPMTCLISIRRLRAGQVIVASGAFPGSVPEGGECQRPGYESSSKHTGLYM